MRFTALTGRWLLPGEPTGQLVAVALQPPDVQAHPLQGLADGPLGGGHRVFLEEGLKVIQLLLVGEAAADGNQPHQSETTPAVAAVELGPVGLYEIPG